MGTITQARSDLSKVLLVACDQSYNDAIAPGAVLAPYADSPIGQPDPTEQAMPVDWNNLGLSDWIVASRFSDPTTGFGATIYLRANDDDTNDYIVAMQGTRGPNEQDWAGNLIYGWDKWGDENSGNGTAVITALLEIADLPNTGKIHFTGQSLGGALAEYALYDFAIAEGESFDSSKVTLTTFNGLGGVQALQEHRTTEDTSFSAHAGLLMAVDTAHFFITNDLVSRLGGGHVNGLGNEYELKFTQTTVGGFVRKRSDASALLLETSSAHRIESGF